MPSTQALAELIASLEPGSRIVAVDPLGPAPRRAQGEKAAGYGRPLRVSLVTSSGAPRVLVFRTALANEFGHDRRADRAEAALLSWDTFPKVPRQVPALDVGVIREDGQLLSIRDAGEFYLVTGYAEGTLYADDLRRIAHEAALTPQDEARAAALARYLAQLHQEKLNEPAAYRRAIRDLVGHGEGIFGIIDAYPPGTPAASEERLRDLEHACVDWRWRLRHREARLCRTHGDFHPFNVVFSGPTEFAVLDTSRGAKGDPADDVAAMAVNYVFFAQWTGGAAWPALRRLWQSFFAVYVEESRDPGVLDALPPFLAWRSLVVANPKFYPDLSPQARDCMLRLAQRALHADRFSPAFAEELFE